jgi:hypothetical protein
LEAYHMLLDIERPPTNTTLAPRHGGSPLPEWLAVKAPAEARDDDERSIALALAIAVVSSLVFWAGLAVVLFWLI